MELPDFEKLDLPETVVCHPGMITRAERALLYWLASTRYSGAGQIVDAGVFLGASTVALASGLADNSRREGFSMPSIHSYDIAIWVASMDRYLERPETRAALAAHPRPVAGESFSALLRTLLAPYLSSVALHLGDIVKLARAGRPVEIAFYDCLKTNTRDLAVFRAFAPHYLPGKSIILQQDYFYESAACNKIRQEYFSGYFEYLGQVSTTAVFMAVRPIPEAMIASDPVATLPIGQKVELLMQAAARAQDEKSRVLTWLACAEFLVDARERDMAMDHLGQIERDVKRLGPGLLTRRPEQVLSGLRKRAMAL